MNNHDVRSLSLFRNGLWMVALTLMGLAIGLDFAPPAAAEQDAEGGIVGIDENQLPPGAVSRIGSPRFRDGGEVHFLAYSADGKRLLSIAGDVVRLRELSSGKVVAQFPGSDHWPVAALSPDGRLLAAMRTASTIERHQLIGGAIAIYDAHTGKLLHELNYSDGTYTAFAFSADSKTLFAGAIDGSIHLIECASGKAAGVLELPDTRPARPTVAPTKDGKDKSSGPPVKDLSKDGGKANADAKEWQERSKDAPIKGFSHEPGMQRAPVMRIVHAADHDTLAVVHGTGMHEGNYNYTNSRVVLWDLKGELKAAKPRFTGAFVSDKCELLLTGKTLTSIYPDSPSRSWNLTTGQTYEPDVASTRQRDHSRQSAQVVPSPNGKQFGITIAERNVGGRSEQNKVTFYLTEANRTGGEILKLDFGAGVMAFSPDGIQAASASGDGVIRLWNTADRKLVNAVIDEGDGVFSVAVSADGKRMATGERSGLIRIHQLDGVKPVAMLEGHTGPVVSLGFSPDGQSLASASRDMTVKVWKVADGSIAGEGKIDGYSLPDLGNLEWTDDARHFVFSGSRVAMVWDAVTTSPLKAPPVEMAKQITRNLRIRVRPRDYGAGSGLSVWSFFAPAVQKIQSIHEAHAPGTFAFNHDASRAVYATGDVITLYDTATGNEAKRIFPVGPLEARRTVKQFTHVGYSPDNRWIVAVQNTSPVNLNRTPPATVDQIIRVFDAATGTQSLQLAGHRGAIHAMTFGRDGKLHTGGEDGTVLTWDLAFRPVAKAITGDPASLLKAVLGADTEHAQAAMAKAAGDDALTKQIVDGYIAQPGEDAEIEARLTDLASEDFVTRFKALRELAAMNDVNQPNRKPRLSFQEQIFRYLLRETTTADAQRRARSLIGTGEGEQQFYATPAQVRLDRVLKLLEWSGTPASQERLALFAARLPVGFGAAKIEPALARIKAGSHRADMPGAAPAVTEPLTPVVPEVVVKPVTPNPDPEPPVAASDLGVLVAPPPKPALPKGAIALFGAAPLTHAGTMTSIALLPDGKTLISSSRDETLRVWDLKNGAELRRFSCNDKFSEFALSPNGKHLVFTAPDAKDSLELYDTSTWQKVRTIKQGGAMQMRFSPDSTLLLEGQYIHDIAAATVAKPDPGDSVRGSGIARVISPDNKTLAVFRSGLAKDSPPGHNPKLAITMEVLDLGSQALKFTSTTAHPGVPSRSAADWMAAAELAADGKTVLTVFGSGLIARWNLTASTDPQVVDISAAYHKSNRYIRQAAFSPDLRMLAIVEGDAPAHGFGSPKLILASAATGQPIKSLGVFTSVSGLVFSKDGRFLAAGVDNGVALFDTRTGRRVGDAPLGPIVNMAITPDGATLVTAHLDGNVLLRNPADGTVIRKFTSSAKPLNLAFKPENADILAVSYSDKGVRSWDIKTGRPAETIPPPDNMGGRLEPMLTPTWSADGKLATQLGTTWYGLVPGFSWSNDTHFCISPDGRLRGAGAAISLYKKPNAFDRNTPTQTLMTLKHTTPPTVRAGERTVTMSSYGNAFANDNLHYALAMNTRELTAPYGQQARPSPHLNRIYVWNLDSQKEVACFEGHDGVVPAMVFAPKGDLLFTGGLDGNVIVWKVPAAK